MTFRVRDGDPDEAARLATIYAQQYIRHRRALDTQSIRKAIRVVGRELEPRPIEGAKARDLRRPRTTAAAAPAPPSRRCGRTRPPAPGHGSDADRAAASASVDPRLRTRPDHGHRARCTGSSPRPASHGPQTTSPSSSTCRCSVGCREEAQTEPSTWCARPSPTRRQPVRRGDSAPSNELGARRARASIAIAHGHERGCRGRQVDDDCEPRSRPRARGTRRRARGARPPAPVTRRSLRIPPEPGVADVVVEGRSIETVMHVIPLGRIERQRCEARWTRCRCTVGDASTRDRRSSGVDRVQRDLHGSPAGERTRPLRSLGEIVLLDSPPLLQSGDALALSARVDGLLFLAQMRKYRRRYGPAIRHALALSPALPLGLVVIDELPELEYGTHAPDAPESSASAPHSLWSGRAMTAEAAGVDPSARVERIHGREVG